MWPGIFQGNCTGNNLTPRQNATFVGACRSVIAVASLGLAIALGSLINSLNPKKSPLTPGEVRDIRAFLVFVYMITVIHFAMSIFIFYTAQLNKLDTWVLKCWMIADVVIAGIYTVCSSVLLYCVPPRKLYIILGVTVIITSLLLCYRSWNTYYLFKTGRHNLEVAPVSPEVTDEETKP